MIRAYVYKLLRSPVVYLCVFGVIAICSTRFIDRSTSASDVLGEMDILLDIDAFRKIITIFGAVPFAANFSDEWINAAANHCIVRCGLRRYAISNVVVCAVSSFLTVFVGMMLFMGTYSACAPFYIPDSNPTPPPYGVFIEQGCPFLYSTLRILVFSLSCSMWSLSGLAISALFPNKYIAIVTPFVSSYVLERISMECPDEVNLWYLSLSNISICDNPYITLFYSIFVFIFLSALLGGVFCFLLRKRVRNEIS